MARIVCALHSVIPTMSATSPTSPLILASGSPRRRELLGAAGIRFEIDIPHIDEILVPGETAAEGVQRIAREKCLAVAARNSGRYVLAADTIVFLPGDHDSILPRGATRVVDGVVYGKPVDDADALTMLRCLSGPAHRVLTAVVLADPSGVVCGSTLVATDVLFVAQKDDLIVSYARSGEGLDKAGAYAVQGRGAALIDRIDGSLTNVIGLPLAETLALLERCGAA